MTIRGRCSKRGLVLVAAFIVSESWTAVIAILFALALIAAATILRLRQPYYRRLFECVCRPPLPASGLADYPCEIA